MPQHGMIVPPTGLEVIVSDHCNISCRQCNHASPVQRKWNVDPDELASDLASLGRVYKPAFLKIIGGEPLLHPQLQAVIEAAAASDISDYLLLVTNGMLLDRLSDQSWQVLSEVEISRYPGIEFDARILEAAKVKAAAFDTVLSINTFPDFRWTFTKVRNENDDLLNKVFSACKMAHVWGCHAIYQGRIFRCPQSIYIQNLVERSLEEGLTIHENASFKDELLSFLQSSVPLASCRYCVGSCGKKHQNAQVSRKAWRDDLQHSVSEMLDYDLLERSLQERNPVDDCKTPRQVNDVEGKPTGIFQWAKPW